MHWWQKNDLRMIQLNLRDIDAAMDVDAMVDNLASFHANTVMVGAGGITSFFPTELDCQTVSPWLGERDTLGDIVRKCHARGIRVIARFDFSKTHNRFGEKHPEWFVRKPNGDFVAYNDTLQTCVCGPYQQERSLEIIREVLEKYPVDGIFFNMFGFQTYDYSGNYFGLCRCDACRDRFRAFCGQELPEKDDDAAYASFKEHVVWELLDRIHDLVQSIDPEVAVCTYHHRSVDMIRDESNSAVDRPLPFWLYSASENVASVEGTWKEKTISNCVINAADIFYRFMGVSPYLTRIRLYESMAAGSGLDWCIIGNFDGYPDRSSFSYAREVFAFHERHSSYYGHMESCAKVLLVRPEAGKNRQEYLGVFKMLKEEHILFDVLRAEGIDEGAFPLEQYAAVILPGAMAAPDAWLRRAADLGIFILATSVTDEMPQILSQKLAVRSLERVEDTRAFYMHTREKEVFRSFPERDWVILDGPMGRADAACSGWLPLVDRGMYGPPERCFGNVPHDVPCVLCAEDNSCAALMFGAGRLYYRLGYVDHRKILTDILDACCSEARTVKTNAPDSLEIFCSGCEEGRTILQTVNLSGFNGTTVGPHLPMYSVEITFPMENEPEEILALDDAPLRGWKWADGNLTVSIDAERVYQAYVIR